MVKRSHELPDQLIEGSEGTQVFSQEEYRVTMKLLTYIVIIAIVIIIIITIIIIIVIISIITSISRSFQLVAFYEHRATSRGLGCTIFLSTG